MKNSQPEPIDIIDKEIRLQNLMEGSDKNDLAQCVRLISLYISMYKKHFGELPKESYEDLFIPGDLDAESSDIFDKGLNEAIAMLDMIVKTNPSTLQFQQGNVTIN
jgi:hypothetical protein